MNTKTEALAALDDLLAEMSLHGIKGVLPQVDIIRAELEKPEPRSLLEVLKGMHGDLNCRIDEPLFLDDGWEFEGLAFNTDAMTIRPAQSWIGRLSPSETGQ